VKFKQILNGFALAAVLIVNWLATSLPINGLTPGQISDSVPSLFTPAGYVFSIWGLIYLWLLAYVVYQALPGQRDSAFVERIGYWFAISSLVNVAWIFAWHYEQFLLSLAIMLGLLGSLIVLYVRLGVGRNDVSTRDRLLVHAPFSVYLGWISVATIANFAVVLYVLGWNGFGITPEVWTVTVMIVAAGLGIAMTVDRKETAYPLVIIWALIGIAVQRAGIPAIAVTAWVAALAVLVVLGWSKLRAKPALG
jgi:phosphoglycerol transferase MdoB-like AlkP superfamily enzyme